MAAPRTKKKLEHGLQVRKNQNYLCSVPPPQDRQNQSAHLYAYQKLALTGSSSHHKIQQHTFQCQNIRWSCPAIFGYLAG